MIIEKLDDQERSVPQRIATSLRFALRVPVASSHSDDKDSDQPEAKKHCGNDEEKS